MYGSQTQSSHTRSMAHMQREIEQRAEAILERAIALMMRPSRVRRNLSSRRARLNWWACV